MDVEGGLISAVLTGGGMSHAVERRVTTAFFEDRMHRRVWEYMAKHWALYKIPPNEQTVALNFPNYEILPPNQSLDFYIDSLANRRKAAMLMETLKTAADINIEKGALGADEIEEVLAAGMMQARVETSKSVTVDYLVVLEQSLTQWQSGVNDTGLDFGFPTLDKHSHGLRPEQYVVFTGLPASKKSWTLLHCASHAQLQLAHAAFVTFEMANREQVERLATLWGKVPYSEVVTKQGLTKKQYSAIRRGLNTRRMLPPLVGVEDTYGHSTVSGLQALVRTHGLTHLYVDGIYVMTDEVTGEPGSSGTQPLTNISRALKRLAKTEGICVVVTTQSLASKTRNGRLSMHSMGYTSAFSQDADMVVGIEQNEDDPMLSIMRIMKNRSGQQGIEFAVRWDLSGGMVTEYGADDDAADEDEDDGTFG